MGCGVLSTSGAGVLGLINLNINLNAWATVSCPPPVRPSFTHKDLTPVQI